MKFIPALSLLLLAAPLSVHAADQTGAESKKKPVSAKVVNAPKGDGPRIGNIEVTYADGTTDRWTTKGNTGDPRVAADGTVGWTIYGPKTPSRYFEEGVKIPEAYLYRPNTKIVICRKGKVLCRVEVGLFHVEEWGFTPDGEKFVVKTRGHHGPANLELRETTTGKLLAEIKAYEEKLPGWAEPYRE